MDNVAVKYFLKVLVMSFTSFNVRDLLEEGVISSTPFFPLFCEFQTNYIAFNKNLMEQKLSKIFSCFFCYNLLSSRAHASVIKLFRGEGKKTQKKLCC